METQWQFSSNSIFLHLKQVLVSPTSLNSPGVWLDKTSSSTPTIRSTSTGKVALEDVPVEGGKTVRVSVESKRRDNMQNQVLEVGSICICLVLRVTPTSLTLSIISSLQTPLLSRPVGTLRLEDSGLDDPSFITNSDDPPPDMFQGFRIGDVVQARVASLGDTRSYYMSTAEEGLGVVKARSVGGKNMVPRNWREMEEEGGGGRERRKVAKPSSVE
ncbi:hypothetical protein TrRE_jg5441 [Triparma retinervis]|uniref:Exosome complex component CSL4 C-terminal domain-containing protein n=1 Tax=Triparma retinervis TaxID=2557542 RepID=A0A9W7F7E3_9STRA|nr:hypothetical protein TrRE_jg5441 [Triparma retinervis]